ncbi:hypothetical protein [Runella sp. SP2]|uniref:hypothetical protein n=1 Tax=Runella sp. SP2 TaxID=2268026 RepID=UPI000F076747|nr:hypothetical protein [Runella sp. SP2]AYQ32469.1 hypothetical protein DTQ70_09925 [Runella sp. SP2]
MRQKTTEMPYKVIYLIIFLFSNSSFGQIFNKKELHPGFKKIITKQFNGTGGKGYWNLKNIDSIGRISSIEYFKKSNLLSKNIYKYNINNDEILAISAFDINNPNRVDTISVTEYKYDENSQITNSKTIMGQTTKTTNLINSSSDTLKAYEEIIYTKSRITSKDNLTVHLNHLNQIKRLNIVDLISKNHEIHYREYYNNGRLRRRKIERFPKPEMDIIYVGGPGSDDETYKYKYYKNGKLKKFYIIIKNKKYLLESYKYE